MRSQELLGTVAEFLELTPEDRLLVEIKVALSQSLKEQRRAMMMTQAELADRIGSSQPRIAKAEGADESVSLELLLRAMLGLGVTPQEIGRIIAQVGDPS